jgi:hypothetical protein
MFDPFSLTVLFFIYLLRGTIARTESRIVRLVPRGGPRNGASVGRIKNM